MRWGLDGVALAATLVVALLAGGCGDSGGADGTSDVEGSELPSFLFGDAGRPGGGDESDAEATGDVGEDAPEWDADPGPAPDPNDAADTEQDAGPPPEDIAEGDAPSDDVDPVDASVEDDIVDAGPDAGPPCPVGPEACEIDGVCVSAGETASGDLCAVCDPALDTGAWTAVACADDNPCTADGCAPASGCIFLVDDALPCSDDDPCSSDDHCQDGACVATPCDCATDADCDDLFDVLPDCTRAACVGQTCTLEADPTANGDACDDGNACTTGSICAGGVCSLGSAIDCSSFDQGACAPGVCDPAEGGCIVTFLADGAGCDDLDACTGPDLCDAGFCLGEAIDCEDGDVCNGVAKCDPQGGCVDGAPLSCDDGDPCNGQHICDPVSGCAESVPPLACDDDDVCNGVESCAAGTGCVQIAEPLSCDDGDACNGAEVCLPKDGCVAGTSPACDDDEPCNGLETCDPTEGCVDGAPLVCDDANACDGLEMCVPGTGCVEGEAPVCDDNDACDGVETCDPTSGCVDGTPPTCSDGDPCNGIETCVAETGCVAGTPPDCGPFSCGPTGCPGGCSGAADCQPGTFCDTEDVDGDGDSSECLAPAADGGPCDTAAQCSSDTCDSGICCEGGPCCESDVGCPAYSDAGGPGQEADSPLLFAEINDEAAAAQSFVSPGPGLLTAASMRFFGNPTLPLTATLRVWGGGLPGQPGAQQLATADFEVGALADYEVSLSPPAHIDAGETYYLAVSGDQFPPPDCGATGCTTSFVLWYGTSSSDAYADGETWLSADGAASFYIDPLGGDRTFGTTVTIQGCVDHVCVQP